jgi:predicted Fe-Mo cluster-binding NifX family protein
MKLVFPSNGKGIDDHIDQRFGRCPYFVSFDTETRTVSHIDNVQNYQAAQGAGIQSATQVVNMHADVCITGHCGPKAFKVFNTAGVRVITGVDGKIREAIARFSDGNLTFADTADVEGHWM